MAQCNTAGFIGNNNNGGSGSGSNDSSMNVLNARDMTQMIANDKIERLHFAKCALSLVVILDSQQYVCVGL